jgi:C1A family cysteine protease
LAAGYVIVFGVTVFVEFESEEVAETGIVPDPSANSEPIGGHCMVIVGYDDSQSRFLVRNPWGPAWSPKLKGHCWISYDYLTSSNASDFWAIRLISWVTSFLKWLG